MSLLLSSVRNAREAVVALAGGSDWIDVKEPRAGALGMPDVRALRRIVRLVGGRVPVSATTGDHWEAPARLVPAVARLAREGVDYVKTGVAAGVNDRATLGALEACGARADRVIVVLMAERGAEEAFVDALAARGVAGIMLDSAEKSGPGLTGLASTATLRAFVERVQGHGLLCGLAGRLTLEDVPRLRTLGADYLGFRGALCAAGRREAGLDPHALARVRAALPRGARALSNTTNEVA